MSEQVTLTVAQLAEMLQIPVSTAYDNLRSGKIPVTTRKIGRHLRLSREAVLAWLAGGSPQSRARRTG